ncbi:hypothetical protein A0U90_00460 [Kozakia baliensis]|nr:hypothetical protein A0U90_00460 [Kozakia baliensis]
MVLAVLRFGMSEQEQFDTLGGGTQNPRKAPSLGVGNQYIRSITFNVHGAPEVYFNLPTQPHIGLRLDVNARQIGENQPNFEVTLVAGAQGFRAAPSEQTPQPDVLYDIELSYSGLFVVQNAQPQEVETLLLVEAPRLLFPSARSALLNLIREAGFPVSNIQPVDFLALWQARRGQG